MRRTVVVWFEPWIFLLFGRFHLHRLWGLVDRAGYAAFWLGLLENRGAAYYVLMAALALPCLAGILCFFRHLGRNPWWRWMYLLGSGYVLFDLAAIGLGWPVWRRLLDWMFDTVSPWWNWVWGGFLALGSLSCALRLALLKKWRSRRP